VSTQIVEEILSLESIVGINPRRYLSLHHSTPLVMVIILIVVLRLNRTLAFFFVWGFIKHFILLDEIERVILTLWMALMTFDLMLMLIYYLTLIWRVS
jgi:hypothetical protein